MSGQDRMLKRYRLIVRLGTGGMAEVYLAVASGASGSNKLQVLKVLRRDVSPQEQASLLQMFEDEGRLAVRLNHPHIIQSHDVDFDAGYHFIAMEYLEGQPLDRIQRRCQVDARLFPLELRLFVLTQVLEALDYAHNLTDYDGTPLRIVHRDVSPQNVFVLYSGHTKLLDFGVAKTLDSSKTQAGVVKGKVAYMAPEQLAAMPVDARSDVYSVGIMLWEAIAGRRMHTEQNMLEIVKRVSSGSLPSLKETVPGVPASLDRIVSRALAYRPEDRYADARSLLDAVLDLPMLRGVSSRDVGERVEALFIDERRELNEKINEAMRSAIDRESLPDRDPPLEHAPKPIPAKPIEPNPTKPIRPIPTKPVESVPTRPIEPLPVITETARSASASKSSSTAPTTVPLEPRTLAPKATTILASYQSRTLHLARSRWVRWAAISIGISSLVVYVMTKVPTPATVRLVASTPGLAVVNAAPSHDPLSPPPSVEPAQLVQVHIAAQPSDASMVLDGNPLPGNPYDGVRQRDQGSHWLQVSAEGYLTRSVEVNLGHDVKETILLERSPVSATSAEPPRAASSTPARPRSSPSRAVAPQLPPNPYRRSDKTTTIGDPQHRNAISPSTSGKSSSRAESR